MIDEKKVEQHYSQGSIIDLILSGIKNMGKTVENITIYDLSTVDEFHIGGLKATQDFINKLNIDSSYHVLDIGCGIGGPSRYTAETFKCKITGIDLTKEYIEVGNKISELGAKVVVADVSEFLKSGGACQCLVIALN